MFISVNNIHCSSIHFTGILGSGMSAIAQFLAWQGLNISGSDRLTGAAETEKIKNHLIACGCKIYPQDGSGISERTDAVCISTAIEESNPDIAAARKLGIPVAHRSDVLASIVKSRRSIAVAGTSGKSTVTAMIFELLSACGMSPSLVSGAALRRLECKGLLGNAFYGDSDLLVIEADESDGTLIKYHPHYSVILNISKDHKSEQEVLTMFSQLISQSQWSAINYDDPGLSELQASTSFGFSDNARFRASECNIHPLSSTIAIEGIEYKLPLPGQHNASNLLAALCVCSNFACSKEALVTGAASYKGVDRRFNVYRTSSGISVVDDFAHNPEKIRAAIKAAQKLSDHITAIYQPHGFGPTRFLKNEYAEVFRTVLRPGDSLYLLPIYYAGGSAVMDIQSEDLINLMGEVSFAASVAKNREDALTRLRESTPSGGCVILMGARDPSLSSFAKQIVTLFGGEEA